jgi:hypothetical protein
VVRYREPVVGDAGHERQQADVIVLTDASDEPSADGATLAILQHDPGWAWLDDPEEDVYTGADVRSRPGS